MIISTFADVVPRVVVAGGIVWGVAHYALIGPKIAERVVAADHLAACTANIQALAENAAEEKLASIPVPSFDLTQEFALRQAEGMLNSPLMNWAIGASRGMGDVFGLDVGGAAAVARRQFAEGRRAADQAYHAARDAVLTQTAARIASADDLCSCIGERAIAETRTEWSFFTGSLTLYTPAPIATFDAKMGAVARSGMCESREGASS